MDDFDLPQADVSPQQLYILLVHMRTEHARFAKEALETMQAQAQQIKDLKEETSDLLKAWDASKSVVSFVKIMGGIGAACFALWQAVQRIAS